MLNRLWFYFFALAFVTAIFRWQFLDDMEVFGRLVSALFDMAKVSVEIVITLLGTLTLWLGFLKIAEEAGVINLLSKALTPLLCRLMPEVPAGHPALGHITMNFSANILGLDNAATPIGLRAMQALQSLNPNKESASNAQIMFLVLNASSLTLLPVSIFVYRAQQGAPNPTDVFLPILLATSASSLAGLLGVAWFQKIKLHQPVLLAYFALGSAFLGSLLFSLGHLGAQALTQVSILVGNLTLISVIMTFLCIGVWRKIAIYDCFIDGAKQGFEVTINLLPYLLAMLIGIGVLRASGFLDAILEGIRYLLQTGGWHAEFVDALPTALIKPFSGSGARGMMLETMKHFGVDSLPARMATVIQGSTETTFYVLAVYFGSVGIKYARHAVICALLADLAGMIAAISVCYWFFA